MTISRPIEGDTALIDKHGQPGGETITAPEPSTATTYAEWETDNKSRILAVYFNNPDTAYQVYEAALIAGVEEPPDTAHDWGQFANSCSRQHLLAPAGVARALRKRTAKSLVHSWKAGPALLVQDADATLKTVAR
jgi:hypothetical protein